MAELPTVGPSAYWAAYRELVKESWSGWWKRTLYLTFAFGVGSTAFYYWEKDVAPRALIFVAFSLLPAFLFLFIMLAVNLLRAPFRMALNTQIARNKTIEDLQRENAELKARVAELTAKQPLRAQLQDLLLECEKYRASGPHPFDAEALADRVSRLCAAFPDEPCLTALRSAEIDIKTVPPESLVLRAQRDLRKALAELDESPTPSGPTDQERLQAAKKLLRDAVKDFYEVIANWSYSAARQHLKWAHRLLEAVFLDGPHKAKTFHIYDASPEDYHLKDRGSGFFQGYAETLSRFEEHLRLPPESGDAPKGQCLDPNFMPRPGMSWRDY